MTRKAEGVRKAVLPVAGLGTRFLACDESDAEGNAAGGGQAADSVRGGRVHRVGNREYYFRYRAAKERD